MGEHGSAQAALAALPEVARAAGQDNYEPCPRGVVIAELKAARAAGARMICIGEPAYPPLLASIDDAPPVLWARGRLDLLQRPAIAVVGARNASSLGMRMARALSRDLGAEGMTIVSGLARGIDTAAHEAALDTGTIAVLGGGVDVVYPKENAALTARIAETGLLLSEQPMGVVPQARHFPRRNRIVSGLAAGLVVVEAAVKSGTLITARAALDQGREVMAVPGHPFDGRAGGCNLLIRDGARLIRGSDDVLEALPPLHMQPGEQLPLFDQDAPEGQTPKEQTTEGRQPETPPPMRSQGAPPPAAPPAKRGWRDMARLHQVILNRLSLAPIDEDQLIRDVSASVAQVAPVLLDLELEGKITRHPGGRVSRSA